MARRGHARRMLLEFSVIVGLMLLHVCEARRCGLDREEFLMISFNTTSKTYEIVSEGPNRKLLRDLEVASARQQQEEVTSALTVGEKNVRRRMYDRFPHEPSSSTIFVARQCWCSQSTRNSYCPAAFNACSSEDGKADVCFVSERSTDMVRFFWPVALFFYAALLVVFLGSEQGASARGYCYRRACLFNARDREHALERATDHLIQRQPQRAEFLFHTVRRRERIRRRYEARRRQFLQDQQRDQDVVNGVEPSTGPPTVPQPQPLVVSSVAPNNPVALKLKTTTYHEGSIRKPESSTGDDRDNERSATCSICLGDLNEGDRVGVLTCSHTFHVECLKPWLKRRNACPLCQMEQVAIPLSDINEDDDEEAQEEHDEEVAQTPRRRRI